MHLVLNALARERFDFVRAPLLAWGQLACLERHRTVSAVVGGSELLMAGCERVILSIDFAAGTYNSVELRRVLEDVGSTSVNSFLDMCVLAGFDYSSTFPPLLSGGTFSFGRAREMVQRYRSG